MTSGCISFLPMWIPHNVSSCPWAKLLSICLEQINAKAAEIRGEVQRGLRRIQEGSDSQTSVVSHADGCQMDVSVQKMKVTWSWEPSVFLANHMASISHHGVL